MAAAPIALTQRSKRDLIHPFQFFWCSPTLSNVNSQCFYNESSFIGGPTKAETGLCQQWTTVISDFILHIPIHAG